MKKSKKLAALILAAVMMLSLVACGGGGSNNGGNTSGATSGGDSEKTYKIALLIPYLGDQSYYDTTAAGLDTLKAKYSNVETTVIETGTDKSKYSDYFDDVCSSAQYDLIISGSSDSEEALYAACEAYPDQLFMNFDYTDAPPSNCYAVNYNTADMGYVAGVLATLVTTSDMEKANPDKKVGVIIGMDIPAMNDFIGGFCQVCTNAGVQVYIGYPESFTDTAKAKELSLEMYNQGVDVIWQVAGSAGTGVFEAAAQVDKYSFGVDSDQTITIADKALTSTIITSFYKDCGSAIVGAVEMLMQGNFPAGTAATLGLAENAVGLIDNEQYQTMVPEEIRNEVTAELEKVKTGEVQVYSVKADPDSWQAIKDAATAPVA